MLLPSRAGTEPRLQPLSTYRLNLSEGKEAEAQFVITWGRAARCYLLDFLRFRGPVSVQAFYTKRFPRVGPGFAAGNVMSCLQSLALFS